jgi:flagellar biosynthetic protein FlhB
MLVILLVVLGLTASGLYKFFFIQARQGVSLQISPGMDVEGYAHFLKTKIRESMIVILPFFIAAGSMSIFASLLGSGWTFAPQAVKLKFDRLNPVSGFKRLFSMKVLFNLLISLVKLTVLLVIVWEYLNGKLGVCLALRWGTPAAALGGIARLIFGLVVRITMGIMAIALIDWVYQRWHYRRELRMTKQEVVREMKDRSISPQVKGRIRSIQMEMARKRMLQEVPTADVVLVNPTHVAVALRYDMESMDAPAVVAKGGDLMCETIKEIARAHKVPIVQRPELARTIYNTVEIGELISETLFVAVAEVLAMVYRARRQRLGKGH